MTLARPETEKAMPVARVAFSGPARESSAAGAAVRTLVVEAREDLELAREARRVVGAPAGLDERAESRRG